MAKKPLKFTTLFAMVGIVVIAVILYVFVIAPKTNRQTLGSSNLILEMPLHRWDISGITPFCKEDNTALTFHLYDTGTPFSSTDGVVVGIEGGVITVEVSANTLVEYFPFSSYNVLVGDFVPKNSVLGKIKGNEFNIRVKNTRSKTYECPYLYLSAFGRSIVDELIEEGKGCDCALLKY